MTELKGRKVIVLASSIKTLRPVFLQLWEHGIEFQVTTTVYEVIKAIGESRPDFVMLAFDHPQYKNLVVLNERLKKHPNFEVIGFVEHESAAMINRLVESGLKYTLQPPVTAPFISRMFSKILKENPEKFMAAPHVDGAAAVVVTSAAIQTATSSGDAATAKNFDIEPFGSSLQQAIDDQCGLLPETETKSVRLVNQVQCCAFTCATEPRLNGVLTVANATSAITAHFNLTLLKAIGDLTAHWMRVKNYHIKTSNWFTMSVEDIAFSKWAIAHSQLYKMCFHEDEEIVFAFFSTELAGQKALAPAGPDFILTPVSAFVSGIMLPFDVYVPSEQKTPELLVKSGDAFLRQRLGELKKSNTPYLLIEKTKEHDLLNYAAEGFVKASIERFNYQTIDQEMQDFFTTVVNKTKK